MKTSTRDVHRIELDINISRVVLYKSDISRIVLHILCYISTTLDTMYKVIQVVPSKCTLTDWTTLISDNYRHRPGVQQHQELPFLHSTALGHCLGVDRSSVFLATARCFVSSLNLRRTESRSVSLWLALFLFDISSSSNQFSLVTKNEKTVNQNRCWVYDMLN